MEHSSEIMFRTISAADSADFEMGLAGRRLDGIAVTIKSWNSSGYRSVDAIMTSAA